MSEKPGSKSHPYMYDVYCSMVQQGCWNGSWVFSSSEGTVYITANQSVERDNDSGYLGSQDNPFSGTAYSEMMLAQTWQGGYVQHGDEPETIIYHRSYEEQNSACGCGCGCGSDSGSGCGCGSGGGGLIAGYDTFRPMGFGVGWNIVVEWGEGNFSGTSQPTVSAALQIPGTNQALALNASWDGCYRVRITGTIKQVGEESGITVYTYNLTEYYNIPGFYHN